MHYLITGGAGFIGQHLCRRLADEPGSRVNVVDNLYRAGRLGPPAWGATVRFTEGDVRDSGLVRRLMTGIDVVFHLAAQSNVIGACVDLDYSFTTNVIGTYNVLSEARRAGVTKVVFTSSREVYGEPEDLPVAEAAPLQPKNAYGASKLAGEAYCRVFQGLGLPVTILRLANVYGPGDRDRVIPIFLDRASSGQPLILYGGDQVIDFVWIGDVIDALLASIPLDGEAGPINIGGGQGVSIADLAEMVSASSAARVPVVRENPREMEVRSFVADIAKAVRLGLLRPHAGSLSERLPRMLRTA